MCFSCTTGDELADCLVLWQCRLPLLRQKEKRKVNETAVQCDLPVKYSDWLRVFYHELTFGVIAAFLFWPPGFILFPDFVFNFEERQDVKNGRQIQNPSPNSQKKSNGELSDSFPVDDESPITFATFINKCVEQCPKTSNFLKLFCLCYLVIPIFGYIFFALNYIFLLDFLNKIEDKQAIQDNVFAIIFLTLEVSLTF